MPFLGYFSAEMCRKMYFYLLVLKMAAGLISLAAIAAVVADNHIPRIAMKYFLFLTLFPLMCRLYKYGYTISDHFS